MASDIEDIRKSREKSRLFFYFLIFSQFAYIGKALKFDRMEEETDSSLRREASPLGRSE